MHFSIRPTQSALSRYDKCKPTFAVAGNTSTNNVAYTGAHTTADTAATDSTTRTNTHRGTFTVTRVMRCVISVVVVVPVYIALPLDIRDLVRMIIEVVRWGNTVLPL